MRDHWWWRPGWSQGRSFYTWHITFDGQPGMQQLADFYAPMLANLPMLDAVPVKWLHLTMQGIGFTDEVDKADVVAIVKTAQTRCASLQPFTATVGPPYVDAETIQMRVRPTEPLIEARACIRDAIATVWGRDRVPEPAEGCDHMSPWLTPTPPGHHCSSPKPWRRTHHEPPRSPFFLCHSSS